MVMGKLIGRCNVPALADPDLQIRGGGGSSRTSEKGGGAVFSALLATVWSKNKGGGPPIKTPCNFLKTYRLDKKAFIFFK